MLNNKQCKCGTKTFDCQQLNIRSILWLSVTIIVRLIMKFVVWQFWCDLLWTGNVVNIHRTPKIHNWSRRPRTETDMFLDVSVKCLIMTLFMPTKDTLKLWYYNCLPRLEINFIQRLFKRMVFWSYSECRAILRETRNTWGSFNRNKAFIEIRRPFHSGSNSLRSHVYLILSSEWSVLKEN